MKKIVLLYQDRDSVCQVIDKLKVLDIDFIVFSINSFRLSELQALKPEIILISNNNISISIQYYAEFLHSIKKQPFKHSAILLVNKRESSQAYLACRQGMFEDYCVINPFNEPYRINLIILKTLAMQDSSNEEVINLIDKGSSSINETIASGSQLKSELISRLSSCETAIGEAIAASPIEATQLLERVIAEKIEELKTNVSQGLTEFTE